jgi:cyclophilin family peptidyl-prolyl cis-trans isomerase/HEAT repeat protein
VHPFCQLVTKNHAHTFFKTARFLSRTRVGVLTLGALFVILATNVFSQSRSQVLHNPTSGDPVPKILLLRIIRAEDERRWDNDLRDLFSARNANVRARATLAAGRIGNEDAVNDLTRLLQHDDEPQVRAMAAFALGEIESPLAADALLSVLNDRGDAVVRARAVEALGKISAALPKEQEARAQELAGAILEALKFEARRRSAPDDLTILLGLTAVLRAKPANAGPIVAEFLHYSDPRIRADAANTLARLKLKDGNDQLRKLLMSDPDPIVRANAARVLGATTDKEAFNGLFELAGNDQDARVRVSAVRALAALKDQEPRVAQALASLWCPRKLLKTGNSLYHQREPECLDLITALGRAFQGTDNKEVLTRLRQWGLDFPDVLPAEEEIARVRISPGTYLEEAGTKEKVQRTFLYDWRNASSVAQGLGEIAALPESTKDKKQLVAKAEDLLRAMFDYRNSGITKNILTPHPEYAVPDVLRAYAAFKPKDLDDVLRKHLKESDVIIRATAVELLGELPPDETNTRALIAALPMALADKELNDAALAILDSLAKQKSAKANDAIKTALDSSDYLVRRKAVAVLKENGAGNFSSRIGTVQTRNTAADYERAIGRIGKRIDAVVTTDKGSFTIRLLPDEATLNVDNFIQLAKRKYFNGITVHRVVPNFVIQDGDPRGDGNGGPGYQIRCEINEVPYARGAVGMALSGKDTGGSQWFVTHSPQPHLDGGYTVFGNIVAGMDTVDNIVRGDVIRSIVIREGAPRASTRGR